MDYYFFDMLREHTTLLDNEIRFIPGAGAKQLSGLISFAIAFSDRFVVLLDNDEEGKAAKEKYITEFGGSIEQMIHLYHPDKDKFELESHLSKADRENLMKITNCDDIKRAIGFLYYDYPKSQSSFMDTLSDKAKGRIQSSVDLLAKLNEQ